MRIIAGSARGQPLKAPPSRGTRPTSDRVRESLFGLLEAIDVGWDRVLDLYAGSGALGIEALSRGAGQVTFVERNRIACRTILDNLTQTGLRDRAQVRCSTVQSALTDLAEAYDIILLDPPYDDPTRDAVIHSIARLNRLTKGGVLVLEHSRRLPIADEFEGLHLIKQRVYGETAVSIFREGAGP